MNPAADCVKIGASSGGPPFSGDKSMSLPLCHGRIRTTTPFGGTVSRSKHRAVCRHAELILIATSFDRLGAKVLRLGRSAQVHAPSFARLLSTAAALTLKLTPGSQSHFPSILIANPDNTKTNITNKFVHLPLKHPRSRPLSKTLGAALAGGRGVICIHRTLCELTGLGHMVGH
jgi:hypothetical protein